MSNISGSSEKSAKLPPASIVINAGQADPPVSRRLFGKFTEHLGTNVYQGMWSQLLLNPEFASADAWGKEGWHSLPNELEHYGKLSGLDLAGAVERHSSLSFAPFWCGAGDIIGMTSPHPPSDPLPAGRRAEQKLVASGSGGEVRTPVFLPLHRIRRFEVTLKLSPCPCAGCEPRICVAITTCDGTVLARRSFELAPGKQQTCKGILEVPKDFVHKPGQTYLFSIQLPLQADISLQRALLFPADNIDGWDPEVVAYMKAARLPLLRFPGGNFVSGYHWADGVGPLDGRPVLRNPAWNPAEFNHVGTDEWLRLCELVGAEPLICVNAGNGTAQEARDWIDYCNAPADTPMGARRAANGHPAPYNVRLWEVGNELYGDWQVGYTDAAGYAKRYLEFIHKMRRPGENLHFIANGADAAWDARLIEIAGPELETISYHGLYGNNLGPDENPLDIYNAFMAFSADFGNFAKELVASSAAAGRAPHVAVTELQVFTHHPGQPKADNMADVLHTAGYIFAAVRSKGLIDMITHSAMLNHGGGLRKERGLVYANPTWWVTNLFASQDCLTPLGVKVDGPSLDFKAKYFAKDAIVPYVDAVALADPARQTVNVFVINRHPDKAIDAIMEIDGLPGKLAGKADIVTVAGPAFTAANTFDEPQAVHPKESKATVRAGKLKISLPPVSCMRITLKARP
jgi:alpha-N-arabinofuranosidase